MNESIKALSISKIIDENNKKLQEAKDLLNSFIMEWENLNLGCYHVEPEHYKRAKEFIKER